MRKIPLALLCARGVFFVSHGSFFAHGIVFCSRKFFYFTRNCFFYLTELTEFTETPMLRRLKILSLMLLFHTDYFFLTDAILSLTELFFFSHGMHGIFSPKAQRPLVHGNADASPAKILSGMWCKKSSKSRVYETCCLYLDNRTEFIANGMIQALCIYKIRLCRVVCLVSS